ncbi:MAG: lactate utilization protein B [Planctomycetota bacterium]
MPPETGWFARTSREKVADANLADKLYAATQTSLDKYAVLAGDMPQWQDLRRRARQVKLHTLTHLDEYLDQFVKAAEAGGATVTWADTGRDACDYIVELARRHDVARVTKAKSMTGEEVEINKALLAAGIEPVETDLGEMICQLAGEMPSHVTAPVIQWSMEEIARLMKAKGVIGAVPRVLVERPRSGASDPGEHVERIAAAAEMVARARSWLRRKFMTAGMGISGANFAVAESGSLVLVENEANIRLSTTLPDIHVAIVGIEKLIPKLADLGTFLSLLPVAATGQRQSAYVSLIHRPYGKLHIILLDNGRSRLLADKQHYDLLTCIRCGACMNVCPVYRHVSGHGYESVYPGPIGAVLTPHLRSEARYRQLPFASSLCGACSESCPVAIPLHERLLQWRDRIVEQEGRPRSEAMAFGAWAWLMGHPEVYRHLRPPAGWIEATAGLLGPGRDWRATRELPLIADQTFASWWKRNRAARKD